MNVKLINAIADQIEKFPHTYDQTTWTENQFINNHCGTHACIAGHACHEAVVLKIIEPFHRKRWYEDNISSIEDRAIQLMDLPEHFCKMMFDGSFDYPEGIVDFLRQVASGADLQELTKEVMERQIASDCNLKGCFYEAAQFCNDREFLLTCIGKIKAEGQNHNASFLTRILEDKFNVANSSN